MYRIRIRWLLTILIGIVLLSACASEEEGDIFEPLSEPSTNRTLRIEDLPDKGAAPELENEVWLNVESPLRISELKGKVVLLDFWTFG
jgi:hypothetical protein